jgi:tetratricopeptide (TPR) repeat protein
LFQKWLCATVAAVTLSPHLRSHTESLVFDFFISYNKADRDWAEWIAWQLEEVSYAVRLQAWDFLPGSNFLQQMDDAVKGAKRTIAVLSQAYLAAIYTKPEWQAAFKQDPTGEKRLLIPVRVEQCEVKGLLGQIVRIDLFGLQEPEAKSALLAGVKGKRAKPDSAPSFPASATRSARKKPRFPGALSKTQNTPTKIWNLPHSRNRNFTGREEMLSELRKALDSGQTAALTQAISGLGGVGKTQLATEYAYRHTESYDVVWWVRSEQPASLRADYAGLAAKLDLPEKDAQEQQAVIDAVKEWLNHNRNWLLVLDNAPNAGAVREYVPASGAGHIIVTSRDPKWRGAATLINVKTLPRSEAVEFLLKRTGQDDTEAAATLAEELGCLPLALEQAGAYIDECGRTISRYLDLFRKEKIEVLRRGKPSTDYPDTVATTWELSFRQVESENPAAGDLLKLCAFFAPEKISLQVIKDGANHLPEPLASAAAGDSLAFDDAIAALRRYSLIEVEGEFISVHRLVQAVTQSRMDEAAVRVWTEAAVRILENAFPYDSDDFRTWGTCAPLLTHALTALADAEVLKIDAHVTASLLNKVGGYLLGRAEFKQAEALRKRALALAESAFDPDDPQVAIFANNLGLVLESLGDLAGAKALFERALRIFQESLGEDHPSTRTVANNLKILASQ